MSKPIRITQDNKKEMLGFEQSIGQRQNFLQYNSTQPPLTVRGPGNSLGPSSQAVKTRIQLPFNSNLSDTTHLVSNLGLLTPNARSSFSREVS